MNDQTPQKGKLQLLDKLIFAVLAVVAAVYLAKCAAGLA